MLAISGGRCGGRGRVPPAPGPAVQALQQGGVRRILARRLPNWQAPPTTGARTRRSSCAERAATRRSPTTMRQTIRVQGEPSPRHDAIQVNGGAARRARPDHPAAGGDDLRFAGANRRQGQGPRHERKVTLGRSRRARIDRDLCQRERDSHARATRRRTQHQIARL